MKTKKEAGERKKRGKKKKENWEERGERKENAKPWFTRDLLPGCPAFYIK